MKIFYDDTAILYVLSYFLIGVQTSIPKIKTSKTFPGCVRSFNGYPTESDSDFSSLKYLVCVALKIRSSARPWNRLPRYSRKTFNEVVEKYMTKLGKFMKSIKIMTQDSVRERILSRREYSSKIDDEAYIPEEFSVLRWSTFLPPLAQISVPNRNISDDYKTTLITNITRGNDIQFEQLGALEGKIYYFSIVIQQLIQKVVKKNIPILKDVTDNILLQNSCCNEGEQNTIEYFIGKEKSIKTFNDNVKDFEELKRYVNRAGRTQQIYIPFDTKLKYPALNQDFDEETIYMGFIHYGKFNTGIDLDFTMKSLIGENTSEFLSTDDISTKISKLKREGKDYTLERFQQLLSYVTKKQGVSINSPTIVHNSRNMLEQNN